MGRKEDLVQFLEGSYNTVKELCNLKRAPPFCIVVILSNLADNERNGQLRNMVLDLQKNARDHKMPYFIEQTTIEELESADRRALRGAFKVDGQFAAPSMYITTHSSETEGYKGNLMEWTKSMTDISALQQELINTCKFAAHMQVKKYKELGKRAWWKDPIGEGEMVESRLNQGVENKENAAERGARLRRESLERYRAMKAAKGTTEIGAPSKSSKDPWIAAFSQAITKEKRKKNKKALKAKDRFRDAIAMRNADVAAHEMALNNLQDWQKKILLQTVDLSVPNNKKVVDEMVSNIEKVQKEYMNTLAGDIDKLLGDIKTLKRLKGEKLKKMNASIAARAKVLAKSPLGMLSVSGWDKRMKNLQSYSRHYQAMARLGKTPSVSKILVEVLATAYGRENPLVQMVTMGETVWTVEQTMHSSTMLMANSMLNISANLILEKNNADLLKSMVGQGGALSKNQALLSAIGKDPTRFQTIMNAAKSGPPSDLTALAKNIGVSPADLEGVKWDQVADAAQSVESVEAARTCSKMTEDLRGKVDEHIRGQTPSSAASQTATSPQSNPGVLTRYLGIQQSLLEKVWTPEAGWNGLKNWYSSPLNTALGAYDSWCCVHSIAFSVPRYFGYKNAGKSWAAWATTGALGVMLQAGFFGSVGGILLSCRGFCMGLDMAVTANKMIVRGISFLALNAVCRVLPGASCSKWNKVLQEWGQWMSNNVDRVTSAAKTTLYAATAVSIVQVIAGGTVQSSALMTMGGFVSQVVWYVPSVAISSVSGLMPSAWAASLAGWSASGIATAMSSTAATAATAASSAAVTAATTVGAVFGLGAIGGAMIIGGVGFLAYKGYKYAKTKKHLAAGGKIVLPAGWRMWMHAPSQTMWFANHELGRLQHVYPAGTRFTDADGRTNARATIELGMMRPNKAQRRVALEIADAVGHLAANVNRRVTGGGNNGTASKHNYRQLHSLLRRWKALAPRNGAKMMAEQAILKRLLGEEKFRQDLVQRKVLGDVQQLPVAHALLSELSLGHRRDWAGTDHVTDVLRQVGLHCTYHDVLSLQPVISGGGCYWSGRHGLPCRRTDEDTGGYIRCADSDASGCCPAHCEPGDAYN